MGLQRSVLPDTGVWVVRNGQWVPSLDPRVNVGGVWAPSFESLVQAGGTWKTSYLRPLPVTLTITSPAIEAMIAGIDQFAGTISGTAVDVLGRPVSGGLITVARYRDGALDQVETVITTNGSGAWTFSFDEGVAEVADIAQWHYRFALAENLPLLSAAVDSPAFRVNSASVALTITSQPSGNLDKGYDTLTVSGTALREDGSVAPGTVAFYMPDDTQTGLDRLWDTATIDGAGNWSVSGGPSGLFGQRRITLHYEPLDGGFEDPTTVYGNTLTFVPRKPSFSKGTVGETSIAMSCSDTQASGYQFYEGGTQRQSGTSRSYTRSGLANYTQYNNFKVRSYGNSPGGVSYYSAFSTEHDARTGRPEKRDSGSRQIYVHTTGTGSYRRDVGWGYVGDKVRQGFYSSSYGGAGYFGLIDFGHQGIYNAVASSIGSANAAAAWCTAFYLGTYRESGVGSFNSTKTATATSSDAAVNSGGDPSGQWQATNFSMQPVGSFVWHNLGARFGEEFLTYKHRSICIRSHSSGAYLGINGRSSGSADCDVQIAVSWNRVTQTKVNGAWLN
jgi:hypothetical protein